MTPGDFWPIDLGHPDFLLGVVGCNARSCQLAIPEVEGLALPKGQIETRQVLQAAHGVQSHAAGSIGIIEVHSEARKNRHPERMTETSTGATPEGRDPEASMRPGLAVRAEALSGVEASSRRRRLDTWL